MHRRTAGDLKVMGKAAPIEEGGKLRSSKAYLNCTISGDHEVELY